jgi:hypothetical protein
MNMEMAPKDPKLLSVLVRPTAQHRLGCQGKIKLQHGVKAEGEGKGWPPEGRPPREGVVQGEGLVKEVVLWVLSRLPYDTEPRTPAGDNNDQTRVSAWAARPCLPRR